ncbi:MAG: Flp pilus assembly protein CpaB [Erysipelotrichaceae bacterium]
MIKKNSLVFIGVLICMSLISFGISVIYINHELELVEVYVAHENLVARTYIDQDSIKLIKVPKAYLSDQVLIDKNEIVGNYVKLNTSIPKGSLVYQSSIESIDDAIDEPALLLNVNQAVFAIDVNISSTAGNSIQSGSKIDIYGTIKNNRETIVDLLFKQVRVLSVKDKNGNEVDNKTNQIPKIMLIAVDQSEIPILTKVIAIGDITITPTSEFFSEDECILFESSILLGYLYAQ